MGGMFQNELFEVKKGTFVRDLLAHLYDSSPCVGCETFCTVWTLVVRNDVFHFEGLLQNGPLKSFLLNGNFHFDTPRMWFRPDKACVYNSDLRETS